MNSGNASSMIPPYKRKEAGGYCDKVYEDTVQTDGMEIVSHEWVVS